MAVIRKPITVNRRLSYAAPATMALRCRGQDWPDPC